MANQYSFIISLIDKTGNALKAITGGVTKLDNSVKEVNTSFGKIPIFAQNSNKAIKLLPNSIGALENKLDELKDAQKRAFGIEGIRAYEKQIKKTEMELARLNSYKQKGISQKLSYGAETIGAQIPALGGVAASLSSPVAIAAAAGYGAYKVLKNATTQAVDFDAGMALVNGTLQLSDEKIKGLKSRIIDLGRNSSTELQTIPIAFNKIVSATGGDLPVSLDILKTSLKAAETGFGDVNQIADATVNTMNSVGKANTTSAEVADVLYATLNKGKVEFSELANYLPQLIPLSNNLGISFKETSGAFAFLTANGLKAEQTTTALKNVFNSFTKSDVRKNFEKIGVAIFNSEGKMRGLSEISADLGKSLSGLTDKQRTDKLASIGLDQESALGLSIMSAHAAELGENITYINNAGGELNRTVAKTVNPLLTWKKISNQISALMLKLGYAILPAVNSALTWSLEAIKGTSDFFQKLYANSELFRDSVKAAWNVLSFFWDSTIGAVPEFLSAFSKIGEKIGVTGESITALFSSIENLYSGTKSRILAIIEGASAAFETLKLAWDAMWSGDFSLAKSLRTNIVGAFDKAYSGAINKNKASYSWQMPTQNSKGVKANTPTAGETPPAVPEGISEISSGGKQQKNITINLGKFQDAINIYSQNMDEGASELETRMLNLMSRVINAANAI